MSALKLRPSWTTCSGACYSDYGPSQSPTQALPTLFAIQLLLIPFWACGQQAVRPRLAELVAAYGRPKVRLSFWVLPGLDHAGAGPDSPSNSLSSLIRLAGNRKVSGPCFRGIGFVVTLSFSTAQAVK